MENLEESLKHADANAFNAMEQLKDEEQSLQTINTHTEDEAPIDLIREKIEQVRGMATDLYLFANNSGKQIAERGIRLGSRLNELRSLVKMSDESWERWAEENLPFISKRNRQKYMLLARRTDCHRHTDLGVDRLEMLCSATKDSDAEDPISDFMAKHGITVEETADVDLEEFKMQVDTALNREKLERRNIRISSEAVETATKEGKKFDKALLKKLSTIQRDGGDAEAYLKDPSSIRKEEDEAEPTVEKEGETQVQNKAQEFKAFADKMIEMVEDILKCPEQISKIDSDSIDELIEKLIELQTAANMNTEEAEAA